MNTLHVLVTTSNRTAWKDSGDSGTAREFPSGGEGPTGTVGYLKVYTAQYQDAACRPHQINTDRLTVLKGFGTNPGSLLAGTYIPSSFPKNGPLVVALHGSTQTAESYNNGSGWSTLADELGVALLFPGQKRSNNAVGGFNWFKLSDSHRGGGGRVVKLRHCLGLHRPRCGASRP